MIPVRLVRVLETELGKNHLLENRWGRATRVAVSSTMAGTTVGQIKAGLSGFTEKGPLKHLVL